MSEKPISPLRRRMIEDMTVRNFVEKTRNDYIRHVRTFTAFLGRSPDTVKGYDESQPMAILGSAPVPPARRSSTHGRGRMELSSTTYMWPATLGFPTPLDFSNCRGIFPSASLSFRPTASPTQLSRLWVCGPH